MMRQRAYTLVELLVVLVILAGLLGLLLPAVQAARERARETVCKNNLHQLNLAVANFSQAHKSLPNPNPPWLIGGWTIEILPFIEQTNLEQRVPVGDEIANAPEPLMQPPPIFRCPMRSLSDDTTGSRMQYAHYVLAPTDRRNSYSIFDAPLELSEPWASGPEMGRASLIRMTGPHHNGFFYASGYQQGVDYMLNGKTVR